MISTSPPVTIPEVTITEYVLRHASGLGDKPAADASGGARRRRRAQAG
jgi:hypothetical protein